MTGQRFADGSQVSARYDAEGNRVEVVDEAGNITRTEFTVFDHPCAVIDAAGGRLEISYDSTMEQTRVTSPDGLVWSFERDRDARVVAETDYNGARSRYGLDGLGRVVSATDAVGVSRRREFSVLGQIVSEESTNDGRTEFEYDSAGDLTGVRNADAVVAFARDAVGRVVSERVNGVTVRSRFDVAGRRSERTVVAGESEWVSTFGFDAAGDVAFVDAGGRFSAVPERRIGFGYDRSGRESERRVGGSARVRQSFDVRGRLARQMVSAGGPSAGGVSQAAGERVTAGRSWSYRPDGYVSRVDDAASGVTRFDLDGVGRVRAVTAGRGVSAAGPVAGGGERFSYSPAGVLVGADTSVSAVGGVASSPVVGPARVDGGGSKVSSVGTLITRVGRDRFSHDGAGRMVRRVRARLSRKPEVTEFSYSDAGQIREVRTSSGSRWRYAYDGLGRRVGKRHIGVDGRLVDEVVFGWDGNDLVLQANTALTSRGRVPAGASSTWVWTYHPDSGDVLSQQVDHTTPDGPAPGDGGGVQAATFVGGWSQSRVDTEFMRSSLIWRGRRLSLYIL